MPIPIDVTHCIATLQTGYERILGAHLVGMYVHGSIAMGCFNPQSSDIDVLTVVSRPLCIESKQALGRAHLALAEQFGYSVELSVVTQATLTHFTYPTPYEFHYSDMHNHYSHLQVETR
jgi:streptomycin 3"-adenylyltransferase